MSRGLLPGLRYTPAQVLPHADTMLLLDSVEAYGPDWAQVGVDIRADSLFADGALGVPGWVGIEYMAQAIAAYSGIERLQQGETPMVGLLIGTRRYDCRVDRFAPGDRLLISARLLLRDESDLAVFACEITRDGASLATAEVKAYRPQDIHRFLGVPSS